MNLQDHGDEADNQIQDLTSSICEGIHSLMLLLVVVELMRINGGKSFALFSNAACEKGRTSRRANATFQQHETGQLLESCICIKNSIVKH
jgi:Mor family transcriptional regulator